MKPYPIFDMDGARVVEVRRDRVEEWFPLNYHNFMVHWTRNQHGELVLDLDADLRTVDLLDAHLASAAREIVDRDTTIRDLRIEARAATNEAELASPNPVAFVGCTEEQAEIGRRLIKTSTEQDALVGECVSGPVTADEPKEAPWRGWIDGDLARIVRAQMQETPTNPDSYFVDCSLQIKPAQQEPDDWNIYVHLPPGVSAEGVRVSATLNGTQVVPEKIGHPVVFRSGTAIEP